MRPYEIHGKGNKKIPALSVNQISTTQHVVSPVKHLPREIYSFSNHLSFLQAIRKYEIMF
jgi:hypothetical protein